MNRFLEFNNKAWLDTQSLMMRVTSSEPYAKDPMEVLLYYYNQILKQKEITSRSYAGDVGDFRVDLIQALAPGASHELQYVISEQLDVCDFGRVPRLLGRPVRVKYRSKTNGHVDVRWFNEHDRLPVVPSSLELIYRLAPTKAPDSFKQLMVAAFQSVTEFEYSNLELYFEKAMNLGPEIWGAPAEWDRKPHDYYVAKWAVKPATILQRLRKGQCDDAS